MRQLKNTTPYEHKTVEIDPESGSLMVQRPMRQLKDTTPYKHDALSNKASQKALAAKRQKIDQMEQVQVEEYEGQYQEPIETTLEVPTDPTLEVTGETSDQIKFSC